MIHNRKTINTFDPQLEYVLFRSQEHSPMQFFGAVGGISGWWARAEVTRRDTRVHFIQPLKERILREVSYGLSLEGASAADLIKSKQAASELVARKGKSA
jgi:hypothetical protein